MTNAGGAVTRYTYEAVGNVATRTDANSHPTGYGHDADNRLVSTTDRPHSDRRLPPVRQPSHRDRRARHQTHWFHGVRGLRQDLTRLTTKGTWRTVAKPVNPDATRPSSGSTQFLHCASPTCDSAGRADASPAPTSSLRRGRGLEPAESFPIHHRGSGGLSSVADTASPLIHPESN